MSRKAMTITLTKKSRGRGFKSRHPHLFYLSIGKILNITSHSRVKNMADLVPKVTPIIIFDPQEKSIRSKI
jgi:hypothetical protein